MPLTGIHDRFVLVRAPAKLNLFLEVRGKRPDGYHELETVMVAVSLFDTLRFQPRANGRLDVRCLLSQSLRTAGCAIPSGATNLAWRALDRVRNAPPLVSQNLGAEVEIYKRIPDQAGLGGGSSDAAAALRAARFGWPTIADELDIDRTAAEVGSDVPFFVEQGISLCRGRGESIAPLRLRSPLWFVVVKPKVGLSTRTIFERLTVSDSPRDANAICAAIERGDPRAIGMQMFNRLQETAESLAPEIQQAAAEFHRLPCLGHQLTGSGSAYFGLFLHRAAAQRAAQILRSRLPGWFVASCRSLGRQSRSTGHSPPVQEIRRASN